MPPPMLIVRPPWRRPGSRPPLLLAWLPATARRARRGRGPAAAGPARRRGARRGRSGRRTCGSRPQRGLRVDAQLAAHVDDDEEQVAVLLVALLGVVGRQQLGGLLGDLVDDALEVGPVVARGSRRGPASRPRRRARAGSARGRRRRRACPGRAAARRSVAAALAPAASASLGRVRALGGLELLPVAHRPRRPSRPSRRRRRGGGGG